MMRFSGKGQRWSLNEIWDRYQLPVMVVENLLGAKNVMTEDGKIHDDYRIDYQQTARKPLALAMGMNGFI